MKKILKKLFRKQDSEHEANGIFLQRELLEKKVDKGTDRAIKDYGEVFKKLAEYDRA